MKREGATRIYVACLAAYNNGHLHGRWIDLENGLDAVQDEIREMLASSPFPDAEEWAIHDYEGFEGLSIAEYEGLDSVCEKAAFIEAHGTLGALVAEHLGGDLDGARTALEDQYAGCFASLADFAEDITEQTTIIPEALSYYIDYERMGRDMEVNDVFTVETAFEEVHVFWSR